MKFGIFGPVGATWSCSYQQDNVGAEDATSVNHKNGKKKVKVKRENTVEHSNGEWRVPMPGQAKLQTWPKVLVQLISG